MYDDFTKKMLPVAYTTWTYINEVSMFDAVAKTIRMYIFLSKD